MSDDPREEQEQAQALSMLDEQAEERIRRVWHDGRWFFSVIDVVGLLTESKTPRRYWSDLKRQLSDTEGFSQLYESIVQLKLQAADGKHYLTDAADAATLLRIVQSIPSPKAEPVKQWLARTGAERLEEMEDPALAADRLRALYRRQGYSDEWIKARLENVVTRNELTAEWRERGAEEGREFAILTDVLHRGTFDLTTAEHKRTKHLAPAHNLRDSMTTLELVLTSLAEATSTALHQAHDSQGFVSLQADTHQAGGIAGTTRRDIEAATGQPVVSSENYKTLRNGRRDELQPRLLHAADDAH